MGPSRESQGVTTHALPGRSVLIWVPNAGNWSKAYIDAGLKARAARPHVLPLPYLSLKPPGLEGWPNIGLPATMSMRYFSEGFRTLTVSFSLEFPDPFRFRYSSMNSQPLIPRLFTCF